MPTLPTKDRPLPQNSLYHQPAQKPKKPPLSIPIQQGQPFRLPQATPKPVKKVEDKESLASLLQSLLDDVPTTFEPMRYTPTSKYTPPVPAVATTTPPPSTTERAFSHFVAPTVPEAVPMYLIIQGHSKVKTYGASKAPSMLDIPYNQLVGDLKTKVRFSREAESK